MPRTSSLKTWCGLPSPAPRPYARLITRSGFTSSTMRITSSNCVMSPRSTGAPIGEPSNVGADGLRSMPTTVSPRAISFLISRGPMNPVAPRMSVVDMLRVRHLRRLPRGHAPVAALLHIHGQVANREALLLAVALDVHLGDAVHDADVAVDASVAIARRDAAIVRSSRLEIADVPRLRLEPTPR